MITKVFINTEYITLGQLVKYENLVESGGLVKLFLSEAFITLNGEKENRRGKKLYVGDIVEIKDFGIFQIANED